MLHRLLFTRLTEQPDRLLSGSRKLLVSGSGKQLEERSWDPSRHANYCRLDPRLQQSSRSSLRSQASAPTVAMC